MPLPPLRRKPTTTALARKVLMLYQCVREPEEVPTVQGYRAMRELIAIAVELARSVIRETTN